MVTDVKRIWFDTTGSQHLALQYINVRQDLPLLRTHAACILYLRVVFDQQLKFGLHLREKVEKAYARLGIIKRNFKCMSIEVFCLLYMLYS